MTNSAATTTTTTTVTGVAIAPNGNVSDVLLTKDPSGSVGADLRNAIDCRNFDCISVSDGPASIDAWVNDEGRYEDEPNRLATTVIATLVQAPCTMLHGTVVFLSSNADDGHTTSLDTGSISNVKGLAALIAAQ